MPRTNQPSKKPTLHKHLLKSIQGMQHINYQNIKITVLQDEKNPSMKKKVIEGYSLIEKWHKLFYKKNSNSSSSSSCSSSNTNSNSNNVVGLHGKVSVAGGHRGGFSEKNPEPVPC